MQAISERFVAAFALFALIVAHASAQQVQPAMSRSKDTTVNPAALATPNETAIRKPAAFGRLLPYEQCGGERGLCNTTTIGVPCGDNPWGLECPENYICKRETSSFWRCIPLVGRTTNNDDAAPTTFSTAAPGSNKMPPQVPEDRVVPVSNSTTLSFAPSSGTESNLPSNVTPEVKACNPGEFAVGNRCFKSGPNSSSGSSRKGIRGGWGLIATCQVGALLLTGLLFC